MANVSITGDTAAAFIVPAQGPDGIPKGFSLATNIGYFSVQGQRPVLTVLGNAAKVDRVVVAFDFHSAASQWVEGAGMKGDGEKTQALWCVRKALENRTRIWWKCSS